MDKLEKAKNVKAAIDRCEKLKHFVLPENFNTSSILHCNMFNYLEKEEMESILNLFHSIYTVKLNILEKEYKNLWREYE